MAKDYVEAVRWLLKGCPPRGEDFGIAEVCLANCYFAGLGVQRDYAQAVQWLLRALHCEVYEHTFNDISSLLGSISALSLDILEAQPVTVKQWRLNADELAVDFEDDLSEAAKGNTHSQLCLGLTYAYGRGVPQEALPKQQTGFAEQPNTETRTRNFNWG